MALDDNDLYNTSSTTRTLQMFPEDVQGAVKTLVFAAVSGAPTLKRATPIVRNKTTGYHQAWGADVNESVSIPVDATGGTWTISFDGETTAAIAFNATAATVKAALEALSNISPGDVTVTGGPGDSGGTTPYVITFGGKYAGLDVPAITTGVGSLTGGGGTATPVITAGGNVTGIIGFLYPVDLTLSATKQTQATVMVRGMVLAGDVALPTGEDQADLDAALAALELEHGFLHVEGL